MLVRRLGCTLFRILFVLMIVREFILRGVCDGPLGFGRPVWYVASALGINRRLTRVTLFTK